MVAMADDVIGAEVAAGVAGSRAGNRAVVAGHYEVDLDAPLGGGGMALVYQGRDLRTRRTVALKTLRPEHRGDPETRARFRREARTMAFLRHPNVARVYDLFEDADSPWVIIELVPGRSLKDEVRARGPLGLDETAHLLDQMAGALSHLHRRGLVHLDVKPQNVIVGGDELTAKLIDFGLAQRAGEPQEMIGGLTFGTAAYLAPEQALGEPVETATDVYALGCVVYELLTGRPPFDGDADKEAVIRAHVERDPMAPTRARPDLKLPSWVDQVVLRALAKRPEERYAEVDAFRKVFRAHVDDTFVESVQTTAKLVPVRSATPSTVAPTPPTVVKKVVSASYAAGGRRARGAHRLRRALIRLSAAVLVANLLVAGLLYVDQGSVPGLIAGDATLEAGGRARVVVDGLRFRAEPGLYSDTITTLPAGSFVELADDAVEVEDSVWWPATITERGDQIDGYVWADGIEPVAKGGGDRLRGRIDDAWDGLRDNLGLG